MRVMISVTEARVSCRITEATVPVPSGAEEVTVKVTTTISSFKFCSLLKIHITRTITKWVLGCL